MKKMLALSMLIVATFVSSAAAQDKPAERPASTEVKSTTPAAPDAKAPVVPEDTKKLLADLQADDRGYAKSMAVLQEKRDALAAEFTRTITRLQLQQPGYELTPALTYVKKDDTKK